MTATASESADPLIPAPTVREAMRLSGFAEAELVAGRGGLDRRVEWVRVIETPETARKGRTGDLLLGLRQEGVGATLTTLIIPAEGQVKQLLGIPEDHALAALVAVGYPEGKLPTRLKRKPVEEFATRERFDGPEFTSPSANSERNSESK